MSEASEFYRSNAPSAKKAMNCLECDAPASGITRYCFEHQHDNWHGWFAWYPVKTLTEEWAWLSFILRRRVPKDYEYSQPPWWQPAFWYRIPEPREPIQ